jgi:hypothetical protein
MASYECFGAIALTGGADGALDAVDGANVADGDVGIAVDAVNNRGYFYTLNATKGGSESSPGYIQPDTNAGSIMWQLCDVYGMDGSDTIHFLSNKPNRVAAGSITANDLVGMDASGDLIKTSVTFASVPETDEAGEWTATQNFNATSLSDGASIAWALNTNQVAHVTLAGNRTMSAPTSQVDGAMYTLFVQQSSSAANRTLAFNAAFKWENSITPTLALSASQTTIFQFISNGTNMFGSRVWKES